MADAEAWLGGRLPLLDAASLTDAQKAMWDRMDATLGHWADEVGFRSKTQDGRFIGPFNPILRSPDIGQSFLRLQHDEARYTSLSERIREIVILSVGSVLKAPYELYAHAAAGRKAGFSASAVEALATGAACDDLAVEEDLARRLTLALTVDHAVGDALYAEGLQRFGEKGLVDLVILAGCYHTVCGMLDLFAVPAPDGARGFEEG